MRRVKLLPLNCVTLGRLRSLHDNVAEFGGEDRNRMRVEMLFVTSNHKR